MKIFNIDQFNQEVDTYKLLSSTNGVGSLVSTTMGTFIMPRDIMSWHFIARANKVIDTKNKNNNIRNSSISCGYCCLLVPYYCFCFRI